MRQKLTELKEEIEKSTAVVENFNILVIVRTTRQNINKKVED